MLVAESPSLRLMELAETFGQSHGPGDVKLQSLQHLAGCLMWLSIGMISKELVSIQSLYIQTISCLQAGACNRTTPEGYFPRVP